MKLEDKVQLAIDAYQDHLKRATRGGGTTAKSTAEQFIKTWQTSNSLKQVARRLKVSPAAVRERRDTLLALGVPLKTMQTSAGYGPEEIERLKTLAASLL